MQSFVVGSDPLVQNLGLPAVAVGMEKTLENELNFVLSKRSLVTLAVEAPLLHTDPFGTFNNAGRVWAYVWPRTDLLGEGSNSMMPSMTNNRYERKNDQVVKIPANPTRNECLSSSTCEHSNISQLLHVWLRVVQTALYANTQPGPLDYLPYQNLLWAKRFSCFPS